LVVSVDSQQMRFLPVLLILRVAPAFLCTHATVHLQIVRTFWIS
jgi:hypothetical protein